MIDRRWPTIELAALWLVSACGHGAAKGPLGTETTGTAMQRAAPMKADATKVAAPKAEGITGRAVVRSGARLYYARTGDTSIVLPPLEGAPGMAVDVTGEQDGRIVIETLGSAPADHHCAAVLPGFRGVRLRFYVARQDLLPVLTAELEHDFGDGTTVRLAPGIPVPPGAATVLVRGIPIRVPVPDERLSRVYEPRPAFPAGGYEGVLRPAGQGDVLRYGGEPLAEEQLYREGAAVLRYAAMPRERDALVVVRSPCLEVLGAVTAERLHPPPPSPTRGAKSERGADVPDDEDAWRALLEEHRLAEQRRRSPGYTVEPGTAIQWVDGSPAGWTTGKHELMQPRHDVDERACFDVPLRSTENTAVVLCFAANDVLGSAPARPSSAARPSVDARRPAIPRVRPGKATVKGSLDKDVIRGIVRTHLDEVRACYEAGLARDAALAGEVAIRFAIGGNGRVSSVAIVDDATLADLEVRECIVSAFERWKFPKSSDESTTLVIFPMVMEMG